MKRLILFVCILCGAVMSAQAQMVYVDKHSDPDGEKYYTVEAAGMPIGSYDMHQDGARTSNINDPEENKRIAYRIVIPPEDHATAVNWMEANDICANLGYVWHLPTQRELQLIWIVHKRLNLLPGFTPLAPVAYWSATEFSEPGSSYVVIFDNGSTVNYHTTNRTAHVRCVRAYWRGA